LKTNRKYTQGFTLTEILVVVAIIAILTAVAIPGYQRYVIQANRTSATACLTEMAQFMERTYTQNMTYAPEGIAVPAIGCVNELAQRYTFSLANLGRRTFTVSATPTATQNDTECGVLTLNQAGQKGALGGVDAATVRMCW